VPLELIVALTVGVVGFSTVLLLALGRVARQADRQTERQMASLLAQVVLYQQAVRSGLPARFIAHRRLVQAPHRRDPHGHAAP
jgi:hypothetical protein